MRQTDKSLQSEKFKQVVGGLGKPLGKSPAPDRIQSPRDLDRSFPCWPGSGYFGTAPGGVLSTAEGPRPFQLGTPDRHRSLRRQHLPSWASVALAGGLAWGRRGLNGRTLMLGGPYCPISLRSRARAAQGLPESGVFSRIWNTSRYIWIYPLESSRHPMWEQNGRHCWKSHPMLRLFVKRLMNIRRCCEQDAAAYRTVIYPNNYSEAPVAAPSNGGVGWRVLDGVGRDLPGGLPLCQGGELRGGVDPLGGTWGHSPALREGHPPRPAPPYPGPRAGLIGSVAVWSGLGLGRGVGLSTACSRGGGFALIDAYVGGRFSLLFRPWGFAEHAGASSLPPRRE